MRVVSLRIGVVLARDGGALKPMLLPFTLGLGGRVGSGRQWWSWIALADVIGGMVFVLRKQGIAGPVNVVGPSPMRNADFVAVLGRALHRPAILPVPEFLVRGAMGEMGRELLLTSARAVPRRLCEAGYAFQYATLDAALAAALRDRDAAA